MRLFEFSSLLFQGRRPYSPGTQLHPDRRRAPLSAEVEGLLEQLRPAGALAREGSVYMFDALGHCGSRFVFEVLPAPDVTRFHTGWLRALADIGLDDRPRIEEYVRSYWAGQEAVALPGTWEYRATSAAVLRQIR